MKKEDIYNAISDIDADILDDVDKYMDSRKARKYMGWKIGGIAAACLVLILSTIFFGKDRDSSFAVTAYAVDPNGELNGTPFTLGQTIKMTPIELSSGKSCFLFSVDLIDKNAKSRVHVSSFVSMGNGEMDEILNRKIEERGKGYFYFLPDEEIDKGVVKMDIYNDYTKADGEEGTYILRIINNSGEFYGQLLNATEE